MIAHLLIGLGAGWICGVWFATRIHRLSERDFRAQVGQRSDQIRRSLGRARKR